MRYVPGLDALRALAAYAVLFGHCPFQSPFLQYLCCILRENSVSLFFALSGFLISGIVPKSEMRRL